MKCSFEDFCARLAGQTVRWGQVLSISVALLATAAPIAAADDLMTDAARYAQPIPTTADEFVVDAYRDLPVAEGVELASHDAYAPYAWNWRDTLSVFLGYEGSKQPQDFGVNAHFGGRSHINWGMPILEDVGLGLQMGTAINATANAVQVNDRLIDNSSRTQSFTTVGLFQRTDAGLVWGLGYDFLYQEYYDNFTLGQYRGRLGWQTSSANEFGVQAAIRDNNDAGQYGATTVLLRPITQGSVYGRHTWKNQAAIGCWVGVAEGHSEANVLGDYPPQDECLVFGSDLFVPLGNYVAMFGESNFMTPVDTGAVDAYLGFEFFPWGGARLARRNPFAPVLPVANNTSMTVDLLRR